MAEAALQLKDLAVREGRSGSLLSPGHGRRRYCRPHVMVVMMVVLHHEVMRRSGVMNLVVQMMMAANQSLLVIVTPIRSRIAQQHPAYSKPKCHSTSEIVTTST